MAERNYIPLSRNLLSDPKIKALQMRYGKAAGVGHWVMALLEMYNGGTRALDFEDELMACGIADTHGLDDSELEELLSIFARLNLIDPLLWESSRQMANSHVNEQKAEWAEEHEKRANAGRKGGKASGASRSASSNASSGAQATN